MTLLSPKMTDGDNSSRQTNSGSPRISTTNSSLLSQHELSQVIYGTLGYAGVCGLAVCGSYTGYTEAMQFVLYVMCSCVMEEMVALCIGISWLVDAQLSTWMQLLAVVYVARLIPGTGPEMSLVSDSI